jgi:hypothetical protein
VVYVRPAYDKQLTQAITTRARDPETPLTVQRNIDEAFRAINGLRILAGASPQAIARALNYNRAINSVKHRFTLGVQDEQAAVNEQSETRVIQETESHILLDRTGSHGNPIHFSEALILPYTFSIQKVQVTFSVTPAGGSGFFRMFVLLGSPAGTGGSQINTNAAGTELRSWADNGTVTLPKGAIKGQESGGGRREIKAGQPLFIRYLMQGAPYEWDLTINTTLTILADKTVGV